MAPQRPGQARPGLGGQVLVGKEKPPWGPQQVKEVLEGGNPSWSASLQPATQYQQEPPDICLPLICKNFQQNSRNDSVSDRR